MASHQSDQAVPAQVEGMSVLVQAVVGIGTQVGVANVGRWIVSTAAQVANARYVALGVIDPCDNRRLSQFITTDIDEVTRTSIGELPHGNGVLGVLIDEPRPIRLAEISEHPSSYGLPPHHPPMSSFLGVPILVRGEVYGNLYLTEKMGGGEFTDADEQLVMALATAAGLAMQNAQLYEQAQQRQLWLETSRDIMTMLLGGSNPTDVFPTLISCVRSVAGADSAFLALPVGDGTLRAEVADGLGAEEIRGMVLPAQSMSAQVMGDVHPVAVSDASHDRRIWQRVIEAAGAGPALFVPVGMAPDVVGTLVVTNRIGRSTFPAETALILESIAAQAAIAPRLGAAAKDREKLAVLSDRDRIARDLHDLVIQRLFATGMSLAGALRGMASTPAADRVQIAVDDLDSTIKEIRATIFALQSPLSLSGDGLRSALRGAVDVGVALLGFEPSLRLDGPIDLLVPHATGDQMLAVLREALSNVAKHAAATAVSVAITVTVDDLCLVVQDNGVGLTPESAGSGLTNLASRARELGGSFSATTVAAPLGTRVEWRVPIGSPERR